MKFSLRKAWNVAAFGALLALASCNATTTEDLKKACAADAILQPVLAPVGAAISPAGSAVVVIDSTTVHPAVTALCAGLTATPVVPATQPQSVPASAPVAPAK